jgi:GntR family transcriptional regulator
MFRLELMRGGGLPTAKVLGIERHPKPDGVPRYGLSSEGHRIRRLRCLDGLPVALEEIWIDAGLVPSLRLDDLTEALYHSYRALFGIEIDRAEDRVGLAPVPEWSCNDFAPPPGAVVGFVERLAAAADGLGVEYSRTWFDPDRVRYVSRMGDGWR